MHAYMRLVIIHCVPISIIELSEFRSVSRYNQNTSFKKFVNVLLSLLRLVEKRIANEMEQTKCAVFYDRCTANNMHFTAMIASYYSKSVVFQNRESKSISVPRLALLSLSPISQVNLNPDELSTAETTRFNAESYIQFFHETFGVFKLSFDKGCVTLIRDNASFNLRIAACTGKPHAGCASHRLNIEVRLMIDSHYDLKTTIAAVHDTKKDVKGKLKSVAVLRNLTELNPILDNETRWSGKMNLLKRFNEVRAELIDASEHRDTEFTVNSSEGFAQKCQRYHRMLSEVDVVTKVLQTSGRTLGDCSADLSTLLNAVKEERENPNSDLFGCKLGNYYISEESEFVHSKTFESAVVKLRTNQAHNLYGEEGEAIIVLRETSISTASDEANNSVSNMSEQLAKRRKVNLLNEEYIDSSFNLGSAAEVERMFSIGGNILSNGRRAMTPQVFEALVFLKLNARLWDEQLLSKAIVCSRNSEIKDD